MAEIATVDRRDFESEVATFTTDEREVLPVKLLGDFLEVPLAKPDRHKLIRHESSNPVCLMQNDSIDRVPVRHAALSECGSRRKIERQWRGTHCGNDHSHSDTDFGVCRIRRRVASQLTAKDFSDRRRREFSHDFLSHLPGEICVAIRQERQRVRHEYLRQPLGSFRRALEFVVLLLSPCGTARVGVRHQQLMAQHNGDVLPSLFLVRHSEIPEAKVGCRKRHEAEVSLLLKLSQLFRSRLREFRIRKPTRDLGAINGDRFELLFPLEKRHKSPHAAGRYRLNERIG